MKNDNDSPVYTALFESLGEQYMNSMDRTYTELICASCEMCFYAQEKEGFKTPEIFRNRGEEKTAEEKLRILFEGVRTKGQSNKDSIETGKFIPNYNTASTLLDRLAIEGVKLVHILCGEPRSLIGSKKVGGQVEMMSLLANKFVSMCFFVRRAGRYDYIDEYRTFDLVETIEVTGELHKQYAELCKVNRLTGLYDYARMVQAKEELDSINKQDFVKTEIKSRHNVEQRAVIRLGIDRLFLAYCIGK